MFEYEMSKARIAELHREADNWRLARAAKAARDAAEKRVFGQTVRGVLRALRTVRRPRGTA